MHRRPVHTRLIAVACVAGSILVASALPASAAVQSASCTKATFGATNSTTSIAKSTLSACTNAAVTGGSGTLVANFKNLAKITIKITWKGTGTSSATVKEAAGPKVNTCKGSGKTKDAAVVTTGTISAGTGKALALKGSKFSESLCVHTGGTTAKPVLTEYLLPGSKILI